MATDRFLITGGTGCIGSWVQRTLDTYRAALSRGLLDNAWLDRVAGA